MDEQKTEQKQPQDAPKPAEAPASEQAPAPAHDAASLADLATGVIGAIGQLQQGVAPLPLKPGYATTEFWLTLMFVAFACAVAGVQLWHGKFDANTSIIFVAGALAKVGYSLSRGMAKQAS